LPASGVYDDMPNQLREKTHVTMLPVSVKVRLQEDRIELEPDVSAVPNLFAQLIYSFDPAGRLSGDVLQAGSGLYLFKGGGARFTQGNDCIDITPGSAEHDFNHLRNDQLTTTALHLISNYMTPLNGKIAIQCREMMSS
jgi:hypothetical protein